MMAADSHRMMPVLGSLIAASERSVSTRRENMDEHRCFDNGEARE